MVGSHNATVTQEEEETLGEGRSYRTLDGQCALFKKRTMDLDTGEAGETGK